MALPIITPPALKRGDTVAILSPSSRLHNIFPLRIERATAFLESQGFHVKGVHHDPLPDDHAQAVQTRVAEVHAAFADTTVRAIVCSLGGFTSNELLPFLDYKLIRANPKILVGMSDITILHHALYAGAGLRSFYGLSAIGQLGEFPKPQPFTWDHFQRACIQEDGSKGPRPALGLIPRSESWTDEFLDWIGEPGNLRPRNMTPNPGWKWLRPGRAEATLWGGCLPSVLQLFGSQWQVDLKGKILLLELPEGDGPHKPWPMELARQNLGDLGMHGVWSKISGLIVGRPFRHEPEQTAEWEKFVADQTSGYDFPILVGVDVGHSDPMLTIPLGARTRIDSDKDTWEILEAGVEKRDD